MKVLEFFRPYLKRQVLLAAAILALAAVTLVVWLNQPKTQLPIEMAEQDMFCKLWVAKIDLELASLRTKYITDRDPYLLPAHTRLKNTVTSDLENCSAKLQNYNAKALKTTLESLAIQLSQKDDVSLQTIDDLRALFTNQQRAN